jgi:hypothetical protein
MQSYEPTCFVATVTVALLHRIGPAEAGPYEFRSVPFAGSR